MKMQEREKQVKEGFVLCVHAKNAFTSIIKTIVQQKGVIVLLRQEKINEFTVDIHCFIPNGFTRNWA